MQPAVLEKGFRRFHLIPLKITDADRIDRKNFRRDKRAAKNFAVRDEACVVADPGFRPLEKEGGFFTNRLGRFPQLDGCRPCRVGTEQIVDRQRRFGSFPNVLECADRHVRRKELDDFDRRRLKERQPRSGDTSAGGPNLGEPNPSDTGKITNDVIGPNRHVAGDRFFKDDFDPKRAVPLNGRLQFGFIADALNQRIAGVLLEVQVLNPAARNAESKSAGQRRLIRSGPQQKELLDFQGRLPDAPRFLLLFERDPTGRSEPRRQQIARLRDRSERSADPNRRGVRRQ